MVQHISSRVEALINETNDAFLSCSGSMNTDYAEFAGMALSRFRHELRDPNLTRRQLVAILRRGLAQCNSKGRWSDLMAMQLKQSANMNSVQTA